MSYLQGPEKGGIPSFKKAIISFWFYVPQKSLDAASTQYEADKDKDPPPMLSGLVPLCVFGKEGIGKTSSTTESFGGGVQHAQATVTTCFQRGTFVPVPDTTPPAFFHLEPSALWVECSDDHWTRSYQLPAQVVYSEAPSVPINPSYIAVTGDGVGESGRLRINFESAKKANVELGTGVTAYTPPTISGGTQVICITWSSNYPCVNLDGTSALPPEIPPETTQGSETLGPIPGDLGSGAIQWTGGDITGDQWHHILIAVDMTNGSVSHGGIAGGNAADNVTAWSLLYVAIDDENIKTGDSSALFPNTNKIVTGGAAFVAGGAPEQTYSLKDMSVPSAPIGFPSVDKYVDKIRNIKLAEFLMFLDYEGNVDTADEAFRRHFITGPDSKGFQHPANGSPLFIPLRKFAHGDPATWEPGADDPAFAPPLFDPSAWPTAIKINGKGTIANVDFTKCQFNWQMGLNLGTAKGKFVRTGKIKAVYPDPKIGIS